MHEHPDADLDRRDGKLIAFPARAARQGVPLADHETRGTILLFTGVRYERQRDDPATTPALSGAASPAPVGTGRRGPRRRA